MKITGELLISMGFTFEDSGGWPRYEFRPPFGNNDKHKFVTTVTFSGDGASVITSRVLGGEVTTAQIEKATIWSLVMEMIRCSIFADKEMEKTK